MANPYGTWTKDVRPSSGTPWKQNAHAREVFRGIDYAIEALEAIMDPNNSDTLGTWTNPYIFAGGLAYLWWDTGVSMFRGKAASLPTSMTDGNLFIMG